MKYFNRFLLALLLTCSATCFGAYDGAKPADSEYVADVPALVRENFRAVKDDAIVNAGAVSGYSVGNSSGNIPLSNGTLNTNLNADLFDGVHESVLDRLDGSRARTGDLKFSGNYGVLQTTSDGSDTGYSYLCGGGSYGEARGASIALTGNEYSSVGGSALYYAGNISTGEHAFFTGGAERFRITYAGQSKFVGGLDINVGQKTTAGAFADSALNVYNPTNIGAYSQMTFGYTPAQTYAAAYMGYVSTNQNGSSGYGDLVFGTKAVNTDTQPTERLRITSDGASQFKGNVSIDVGQKTTAGSFADSLLTFSHPSNINAYAQMVFGYVPGATYASAYLGFLGTNQGGVGYGDLVLGTRAVNTDTQPTERGRVTAAGRFLLGASADDGVNALQVTGGQSVAGKLSVNAGTKTTAGAFADASINLYHPTNIGAYSQITFGYTAGTYAAAYLGFLGTNQAGNGYGDIVFGTRAVNTDTQPSERGRITAAGNWLLGGSTDDGANKLQVTGGAAVSGDLTVTGASTNFQNAIKAVDGAGSGVDADTVDSYAPNTNAGANTLVLRDATGAFSGANNDGAGSAITGYNSSTGYGLNGGSAGGTGIYGHTTSTGTGVYGASDTGKGVVGLANSGGYDFYAAGAGTDYGTSSSIRWKKNRKPIRNALGIVEKLEGLRFTWDKEHGGLPGVGFIAEEVYKYLPEIVVMDPTAPGYADGMDYSKMTPLLLQAIKELSSKQAKANAALLRRIDKQQAEIDELKRIVSALAH